MEGNVSGKFKRVCVFCGSNSGNRKVFSDAAIDLGNELVGFCFDSQVSDSIFLLTHSSGYGRVCEIRVLCIELG